MNHIVSLHRPNSARNRLFFAGAALGVYWFAMFLLTHLPPEILLQGISAADEMMADGGDKLMHLIAYAGLTFLFASWQWMRGADDRRLIGLSLIVPGLYAIFDELLQIPVRRTADLMDCFADWGGVLAGLTCFLLIKMIIGQIGERVSSAEA